MHYFRVLDACHYIGHAAPSHLFFQFARDNEFVSVKDGERYFELAREPKQIAWYDHCNVDGQLAWTTASHSKCINVKKSLTPCGHMQRQAQQLHLKSAGIGAFHLRLLRVGRQTSPIAQKTLFVPVSKAPVINALKSCPNISPPVREQCLLAFSASSQYSHRFNSESSATLVCSTLI